MSKTLQDLIDKKDKKKVFLQQRKEYKKYGNEIPVSLWNSKEQLDYFLEIKKKSKLKITEAWDTRSKISAMGAIKNLGFTGTQFVNLVHWLKDRNNLTTIWHAIKSAKEFKKEMKHLFIEE